MEPPYLQRAKAFKSELFDSAGVEEKLLQKENEFMDLKKNMKLKVWEWKEYLEKGLLEGNKMFRDYLSKPVAWVVC